MATAVSTSVVNTYAPLAATPRHVTRSVDQGADLPPHYSEASKT
jgi:hypothetical protein